MIHLQRQLKQNIQSMDSVRNHIFILSLSPSPVSFFTLIRLDTHGHIDELFEDSFPLHRSDVPERVDPFHEELFIQMIVRSINFLF